MNNISINNCKKSDIENFMFLHSKEFIPSFTEQVDVVSYSEKIRDNAETFEFYNDNTLKGLLCCYLNKDIEQIYIPYICVATEFANQGIGTMLFNKLLTTYTRGGTTI